MEIKKFDQIDTLRFFAVFLVVSAHWHWAGSDMFHTIDGGARGVDLFFVISGFLITLGLLRSKNNEQTNGVVLYKFYMRRFLRIFPIYYLTLLFLWFFDHWRVADEIWWYLLYISNFYSIKMQAWPHMGHLWSLAVEEQFYLVWPLLILLTPKKWLSPVIGAAIILSVATKTYWQVTNTVWWYEYMHPLGTLDCLAIGALLSYFFYNHQARLRVFLYNPWVSITAIALGAGVIYSLNTAFSYIGFVVVRSVYGIFCAWLIGRAAFGFTGITGFILNRTSLRYIGKISYAIYLFHPMVPELFGHFKKLPDENIMFATYAISTVALASASWFLFERRILKFKNKFE